MSAQDILLGKYGPPDEPTYQTQFCEIWYVKMDFHWFPANKFMVNKDFKIMLAKAFAALEAAGLHTEIKTFDGCFNLRMVRGRAAASLHSWGAAIDLNAATNGMVYNPTPKQRLGTWSQKFVDTMKSAGVFFGGDFLKRADPMHFGLLDG